jgi:hypothetical protein
MAEDKRPRDEQRQAQFLLDFIEAEKAPAGPSFALTRIPMPRPSLHIEPDNALDIARHYIRDVIYGANDGSSRPLRSSRASPGAGCLHGPC